MSTATLISETKPEKCHARTTRRTHREIFDETLHRLADYGEGPETDMLAKQCMEAFYETPLTLEQWDEIKRQAAQQYGDPHA